MAVQPASAPTPHDPQQLAGVTRKDQPPAPAHVRIGDTLRAGRRAGRRPDDAARQDNGPLPYALRPPAGLWPPHDDCPLPVIPPPSPATAAQLARLAAVQRYVRGSLPYGALRAVVSDTQFAYAQHGR
jgi:hypothetical protein